MADKAGLKPGDFLLEVRSHGQGGKGVTMVGVTGWTTGRLPTRGKGQRQEGVYYGRGDRVDKGSMADKAGLKPGDFLLEVRSQ